jgi:hypothetical protein
VTEQAGQGSGQADDRVHGRDDQDGHLVEEANEALGLEPPT